MKRLVSVGYEGRDVSELIGSLRREGVAVLIDVRLNPISRKPGMSKRKLAEALGEAGIEYVHMRELGNPKDNRDAFRQGDRVARERFRRRLRGEEALMALQHVAEYLDHDVVGIMCFEHEHNQCHRGLVAEALAEGEPGLAIATV